MSANSTPTAEPIEGLAEALDRAAAGTGATAEERRGAKRFAFSVVQLMAQYDRTGMPSRDRFQHVQCQDVSASGISFLWPRIPDFEYIVIGLETAGSPIYVTARVISVRPSVNPPGQLLVGCQFTGRVNTY